MSLVENTKDDYSINKRTGKHHLIFMDQNDKAGAYMIVSLSVQQIIDSEDGHYLGMNSSLSAELFETEHCTVAMKTGVYRPIAYRTTQEAKEKLGIPENERLYELPFNIEGDSFDLFVEHTGIENVVALFDQERPFDAIIDALCRWDTEKNAIKKVA